MGRPFLCLLLVAAACRSSRQEGPTTSRVVIKPPDVDSEFAPKQPPEWFDEQLRAAGAAFREDRLGDALRLLYAARSENPGPRHRKALYSLLQQVNRAVLEVPTLEAAFEAVESPVPFGSEIHFRVRFRNVSGRTVRVPAELDEGASMLVLDVTRREYDTKAQLVTTTRRVHQRLGEALEIAPDETAERVYSLGSSGNHVPLDGFRVYVVEGVLRPVRLEVGDLFRWDPVPLRPGTLLSLRDNYEHLADDPVARIGEAVEKRAPVHLLTASALVPPGGRRDAVDRLVESLGKERGMDYPIYSCLHYLTELDLGREADAWRVWWKKVRTTYFAEPKAAETNTPAFSED